MNDSWTPIRQKSALYRNIRHYFEESDFLEVETPILTPNPIPEAHINLFRTQIIEEQGTSNTYLSPSPEVWMKQILALGSPSIYQIARCFRNGEQQDNWHRLEFTMLEWYEIGAKAKDNIHRMEEIFAIANRTIRPNTDFPEKFRIMTMNQAFEEFAGFSLEKDLQNAGYTDKAVFTEKRNVINKNTHQILTERLKERKIPLGDTKETIDDIFHRLFISLVEENLPSESPLILKDWPALIPTLAKNLPGTPWADRWEMYYRGVEVANCYTEENNLDKLKIYWEEETSKQHRHSTLDLNQEQWPLDIAQNMPSCSGVALGLDRLLALIRKDTSLQGLDLFPNRGMIQTSNTNP